MGLKNRDASMNYLRIREGNFYIGKDKDTPYSELEGRIIKMYYKDEEYEGTPQRKLIIIMNDGEESYHFAINTDNASYSKLIGFLKNVDINKTLTLHPKYEIVNKDNKEIKNHSILVSQDGKYAKTYFTEENRKDVPEWEIGMIGRKKVVDKSAYLEYMEKFTTEHIINNINNVPPHVIEKEDKDNNVEDDAKLPWD